MCGIIDEVDLVASSDHESPTRCGDIDCAESAIDGRNEDFLAGWHDRLVLKTPENEAQVGEKGGSRTESAPD
jgi:hypothetical protein